MFGFGLRGRTGEVIRRGAYALFLGDYIDKTTIDESELNDEAKAALYFYAAANCLYDLYLQMKMSVAGDKDWANITFFMDNALNGIEGYERERKMPRGALAVHCIPVLAKIGDYAAKRGVYPDLMSAQEVDKLDDDIDVEEVRKLIVAGRDKFHAATEHMFTKT
ncbi:hypothetical protein [Dyella caseinilytica]|uniref:HEPN domain-containing protein n=1 Tax=Dyella caseinilytica TaxID=1849581 RepID=A0ABX7GQZ6_9GAMM|nr:hypothetical protein [Dyella caseinilytica]QRN52242.1 hypothetical protein ISN74_12155 [Dyella caseinilytica]